MNENYNLTVNEIIERLEKKQRDEWRQVREYEAAGRHDLALEKFNVYWETARRINQMHLAVYDVGIF